MAHVQFGVHQDLWVLFCKAFPTGFVDHCDLFASALSVFEEFHILTLRFFLFGVNHQIFSNCFIGHIF